jgi:phospholipid transport system transporter-binding protein
MSARRSHQGRLSAAPGGPWSLTGALTFDTVSQLWLQGGPLLTAAAAATTEVDLAGVERVDSAGLALLVAWQAQVQAAGGVLCYRSMPERLRAIARISEAEAFLGS